MPWIDWLVVVMVSVFATMVADVVHVGFGVPSPVPTVVVADALAAIFVARCRGEGTLSTRSIDSPRRERSYWAAVPASFALGTATGQMTATPPHLGDFAPGVPCAIAILIPWARYARHGLNPIVAFWAASILARPLGASFADAMAASAARRRSTTPSRARAASAITGMGAPAQNVRGVRAIARGTRPRRARSGGLPLGRWTHRRSGAGAPAAVLAEVSP